MKESPNIPARRIGSSAQNLEGNRLLTPRREPAVTPPKPFHWIVFLIICCLLGFLVFKTVVHLIRTDSGKARMVRRR